jgi:hypothetical protein
LLLLAGQEVPGHVARNSLTDSLAQHAQEPQGIVADCPDAYCMQIASCWAMVVKTRWHHVLDSRT